MQQCEGCFVHTSPRPQPPLLELKAAFFCDISRETHGLIYRTASDFRQHRSLLWNRLNRPCAAVQWCTRLRLLSTPSGALHHDCLRNRNQHYHGCMSMSQTTSTSTAGFLNRTSTPHANGNERNAVTARFGAEFAVELGRRSIAELVDTMHDLWVADHALLPPTKPFAE